ncbi:transcription initiation factor TFIID subunit 1-like [Melanaphis sacchari]|uniref:transcription initiation factor TFIID subunit 1-like n=1 Tax=Melanaphis sacchari TaxID=742174 RepID=UPI000DC13352|nr:transcription initiation factor TFIID subunit 1-like [Melanaphis sacchari]
MNFLVITVVYAAAVFLIVCGEQTREVYIQKHNKVQDLETSASGYIYRMDGQNPPLFIKLGEGNNDKFDAILENFKKENGFHGMPVVSSKRASPYNIPVVGEEEAVNYNNGRSTESGYQKNSQFGDPIPNDFDDGRYGLDDADYSPSPISNVDGYNFDNDNNGDTFDFELSPFKYHRDVSDDGLKGDGLGFDDQNYFGSPYTHKEYKSPGKYSKAGGSYKKAGHYFSQGTLGDSGYKNHHDFDKSHAGKYGKDDLKSHYKKAKGHSTGHKTDADHYGHHKSGTHGVKGQKFGETENHKKGHKTTGFHNVYHKDEYNKEQKFYDNAHKHGKYDKYGGKHKDFTQKAGGSKHGTSHESGYDEAHKGSAGQFNKGNYYDNHKGHSGESGHKSHHDHKAEYDTLSDNKKYGEHESAGGDDFY